MREAKQTHKAMVFQASLKTMAGRVSLLRRLDHRLVGVGQPDQRRTAFLIVNGRCNRPDLIGSSS
jgi:hypothetical protein